MISSRDWIEKSIHDLFSLGFTTIDIGEADGRTLSSVKREALAFFHRPAADKQSESYVNRHLGHRFSGIEFSARSDRPDLNESLSYSHHSREAITPISPASRFYAVAEHVAARLDLIAQALLTALREHYASPEILPDTREGSWLQVNFYQPSSARRAELQDKHEDGHLFTIWNSEQPGMEIFVGGGERGTPVVLKPTEVLVLPGGLLTLLTGGDIEALYHQVSRSAEFSERISVMYFVNPSVREPLGAYNRRPGDVAIDIAALGAKNPASFGLPEIVRDREAEPCRPPEPAT